MPSVSKSPVTLRRRITWKDVDATAISSPTRSLKYLFPTRKRRLTVALPIIALKRRKRRRLAVFSTANKKD